jgi:hypothetical protein
MGAIDHATGDHSRPLRTTCLQVSDISPAHFPRLKKRKAAGWVAWYSNRDIQPLACTIVQFAAPSPGARAVRNANLAPARTWPPAPSRRCPAPLPSNSRRGWSWRCVRRGRGRWPPAPSQGRCEHEFQRLTGLLCSPHPGRRVRTNAFMGRLDYRSRKL